MSNPDVSADKPDAEEVMAGDFGAQDFDVFDNNDAIEQYNEEMTEEVEELQQKFASLFTTKEGQEVLEHLMEMTLRRSTFHPQSPNPEATGYFRSGENNIVAYIIQQIKQGQEE